ncbi:MAG: transcription termination/antitermination protein NusG [bacterium]|nr:transcription termination/antitermination protein NusG [bacterium]
MADQDENQLLEEAEEQTTDPVEETPVGTSDENPAADAVEEVPADTIVEDEYDTEVANVIPNAEVEPEPFDAEPVEEGASAPSISERGSGSKKLSGHIVISKTEDPKALWYVVHSSSGHEARVAESLRQRVETMKLEGKVFEILIPTQDKIIIKSGKKYTIKEKIFPGYILVKLILDEDAWLAVRTTPGITGFVGTGNKPTPLSESEVANITKFVSSPAARYKVKFSVGEAVKITDGPFSQQLGTINEMDEEKGKVKVLVSIFGRETPVELDFLQIAKI